MCHSQPVATELNAQAFDCMQQEALESEVSGSETLFPKIEQSDTTEALPEATRQSRSPVNFDAILAAPAPLARPSTLPRSGAGVDNQPSRPKVCPKPF